MSMGGRPSQMQVLYLTIAGVQPNDTLKSLVAQTGTVRTESFSAKSAAAVSGAQFDLICIETDDSVIGSPSVRGAPDGQPPPAYSSHTHKSGTADGSASSSSAAAAGAGSSGNTIPIATFLELLHAYSDAYPSSFIVVCSVDARGTEDARFRWACFEQRVQMVSSLDAAQGDLAAAITQVATLHAQRTAASASARTFACPICAQSGLPEDALREHVPLFHCNQRQTHKLTCPVCRVPQRNFGVHVWNDHGPAGRGEVASESRVRPNVIYPYSLCVVQRPSDGKFLMVQEFCSSGFWLPGGRCENGESLQAAALRETKEEAGVDIELTGVLRVEYSSQKGSPESDGHARLRVIFLAKPVSDSAVCKTLPDYESVGAAWVSVAELSHVILRGSEPAKWFPYVANGGEVHPLSVLKAVM